MFIISLIYRSAGSNFKPYEDAITDIYTAEMNKNNPKNTSNLPVLYKSAIPGKNSF